MELTAHAVAEHWRQTDPFLAGVFADMGKAEDWALDRHPGLQERIAALGESLGAATRQALAPSEIAAFSCVLGFIRAGHAFRVIAALEDREPGFSERLLAEARDVVEKAGQGGRVSQTATDAARIQIDRFRYLARFALLARVFSRQRVELVRRAVEDIA